jgi:hypothetical protein
MFGPRSDVIEALKRQRVQPITPQQRPAQPTRIAQSETNDRERPSENG